MRLAFLYYADDGTVQDTLDKPDAIELDLEARTWTYLDNEYAIGKNIRNQGPKAGKWIGVFDKEDPVQVRLLIDARELARERLRRV